MRKVLDQMYPGAILKAVMAERKFQDEKYGTIDRDGGHELGAWLIIIEKELDEAKDALVHGGNKRIAGRNSIRAEIIQVAAVCFAALEQHGITETGTVEGVHDGAVLLGGTVETPGRIDITAADIKAVGGE